MVQHAKRCSRFGAAGGSDALELELGPELVEEEEEEEPRPNMVVMRNVVYFELGERWTMQEHRTSKIKTLT